MTKDSMVDALLVEREGYLRRGLADRVAQVDEQLQLRGYDVPSTEDEGEGDTSSKSDDQAAQDASAAAAAGQRAASQQSTTPPKRRGRPRKQQTVEQPAPDQT